MKPGTKSILFGAHQFLIHPLVVFIAWWKLYGFPNDIRLITAFIVHDWGYWGKPNMDGPEGETHVILGARIMTFLFDRSSLPHEYFITVEDEEKSYRIGPWGQFSLFHSRFYAKAHAKPYSQLCVADKYSPYLEPWWLYLPRVIATGEIREYMNQATGQVGSKYTDESNLSVDTRNLGPKRAWFKRMSTYGKYWALTHRNLSSRAPTSTATASQKLLNVITKDERMKP
jgi:hypothetical protein